MTNICEVCGCVFESEYENEDVCPECLNDYRNRDDDFDPSDLEPRYCTDAECDMAANDNFQFYYGDR